MTSPNKQSLFLPNEALSMKMGYNYKRPTGPLDNRLGWTFYAARWGRGGQDTGREERGTGKSEDFLWGKCEGKKL